jgi:hypothetical protein
MNKRTNIPNPNKLSNEELAFIQNTKSDLNIKNNEPKTKFKGRMISMSDDFYKELNQYLKENPTEGNRSGFIVRVVAEYIKSKKSAF